MIRKSQLTLDAVREVFESAYLTVQNHDENTFGVTGISDATIFVSIQEEKSRIKLVVFKTDELSTEDKWRNATALANGVLDVLPRFWVERWDEGVAVLAIVHLLADPSIPKRQIVVAARDLVADYEEFVAAILHSPQ
jgi:glutamine cyclotransferase